MDSKINGIILAGGKNTRMQGMDKAFLEINGTPIVAGLIDKLGPLVNQIIIVTNNPQKYSEFKVQLVKDESPDKGPLMGIYSGLRVSSADYNFVMACDMPFVNLDLIGHIIDNKDGFDIIVPKIDEKYHPLFGIYSRKCIPVIEDTLKNGELKVRSIFPKLKTYFLSKEEVERFDKSLLCLENINTKEELAKPTL